MIPTIHFLREAGRRKLDAASVQSNPDQLSALDADLLLAHALGISRLQVITSGDKPVSSEEQDQFNFLIERRSRGEPLAYITGIREFYGREFIVTPDVLIPRPETELIVELALRQFALATKGVPSPFLLIDAGVGSGSIILSILAELRDLYGENFIRQGTAFGLDLSSAALGVAEKNCALLGLAQHVRFIQSDLFNEAVIREALNKSSGGLRIVVSNPPYIPQNDQLPRDVHDFEPEMALRAGLDGLDLIRRLVCELTVDLKGDLKLFVECGIGQTEAICQMLRQDGIDRSKIYRDLAGIERVVAVNTD